MLDAKDQEHRRKWFKNCPRGRPQGQGRLRGLHLSTIPYYTILWLAWHQAIHAGKPHSIWVQAMFSCNQWWISFSMQSLIVSQMRNLETPVWDKVVMLFQYLCNLQTRCCVTFDNISTYLPLA